MQVATGRRFPHIPAGTGEAYTMIGEMITFKVTSSDTGGRFSVMELRSPPGGGPPLHTHPAAETFTILEGAFEFSGLDGDEPYTIRATPGDTVYIPGGAPHTYKAVGDAPSRATLVLTPGTEMEGFFSETATLVSEGEAPPSGPPDMAAMLAAAERHGIAFLAP